MMNRTPCERVTACNKMASPSRRLAVVQQSSCVACGCCLKVCPRNAIRILNGCHAAVNPAACVGCGKCEKECPACVISMTERGIEKGDIR